MDYQHCTAFGMFKWTMENVLSVISFDPEISFSSDAMLLPGYINGKGRYFDGTMWASVLTIKNLAKLDSGLDESRTVMVVMAFEAFFEN